MNLPSLGVSVDFNKENNKKIAPTFHLQSNFFLFNKKYGLYSRYEWSSYNYGNEAMFVKVGVHILRILP